MRGDIVNPMLLDALALAKRVSTYLEGAAGRYYAFAEVAKDAHSIEALVGEVLRVLDADATSEVVGNV